MTTLKSGPFKTMYTSLQDEAQFDVAHYLMNLWPRGTELVQRPPVRRMSNSTITSASIRSVGTRIVGTTYQAWVLTTEPAIYEMDTTAATLTEVVSAANFASAGLTGQAINANLWKQYQDDIVFVTNGLIPFTWDGTAGAGGLTTLTNAGTVVGTAEPAIYYGKLFFIKSADRRTMVWSEENDPTTGYEAGGYNNAWTLSQSSANPLTALIGTNAGLYFFRDNSIGLIHGAVTPDFSTSGVRDEVSTAIGIGENTGFPNVVESNNALWFTGTPSGVHYLPIGGTVQELPLAPTSVDDLNYNEPFGFIDELQLTKTPRFWGCFAAPSIGETFKDVVLFLPNASGVVLSGYRYKESCLVVDAVNRRSLGWSVPYHSKGTGTRDVLANVRGVVLNSRDTGIPILGDNVTTTRVFTWGWDDGTIVESGPDENADGTAQTTVFRMIGPPMGYDPNGETAWHFDRMHLKVYGEGTVTGTAQYLTSEKSYKDEATAAQTWTTTHDSSHRDSRIAELGLDENGRWLRPVIAISSNSIDKVGIGDITMDAFRQPIEEFNR